MNEHFDSWTQGYLHYLRDVGRKAPGTVRDVRCTLKRVRGAMQVLRADVPLWKLALADYLKWLEQERRVGTSPQTLAKYLSHVRGLLDYTWEGSGRVAVEALLNGIPVLASRRGALPEVLAEAGFLFDIPEQYTPETRVVPAADEIEPWVQTIIQLWDDPELYVRERRRSLAAAELWQPERVGAAYADFFAGLLSRSRPADEPAASAADPGWAERVVRSVLTAPVEPAEQSSPRVPSPPTIRPWRPEEVSAQQSLGFSFQVDMWKTS